MSCVFCKVNSVSNIDGYPVYVLKYINLSESITGSIFFWQKHIFPTDFFVVGVFECNMMAAIRKMLPLFMAVEWKLKKGKLANEHAETTREQQRSASCYNAQLSCLLDSTRNWADCVMRLYEPLKASELDCELSRVLGPTLRQGFFRCWARDETRMPRQNEQI